LVRLARRADAVCGLARALDAVDEGNALADELGVGELGKQPMADRLGGDAGSVGYVEDRPYHCHRITSPISSIYRKTPPDQPCMGPAQERSYPLGRAGRRVGPLGDPA